MLRGLGSGKEEDGLNIARAAIPQVNPDLWHADALEGYGRCFAKARRLQAAYSLPHVEKHLTCIDVLQQPDHEEPRRKIGIA